MSDPTPVGATSGRPGAAVWMLLAGMAAMAVAVGLIVMSLVTGTSGSDRQHFTLPLSRAITLDAGSWTVYELGGQAQRVGNATRVPVTTRLTSDRITVTDPKGLRVAVDPVSGSSTFTENYDVYVAVGSFRADSAGSYDIQIQGTSSQRILIAPSGPAFSLGVIAGIAAMFVGILLVTVSLFMRAATRRTATGSYVSSTPRRPANYEPSGYAVPTDEGRTQGWQGYPAETPGPPDPQQR